MPASTLRPPLRTARRRLIVAVVLAFGLVTSAAVPAAGIFQERSALLVPGSLGGPTDVAVDEDGNVFVTEYYSNRVSKYAPTGVLIKQWGTTGGGNTQFSGPMSVAIDSQGNVYVADSLNARVQKFTGGGQFVLSWGGAGSGNGQFSNPVGIAVDAADRVYVVDNGLDRLQKFTASGVFLTAWGSGGSANGQFISPFAVDVDKAGNVYVADRGNFRVQKFSTAGLHRKTWGSAGSGPGQFQDLHGLAVDHDGAVLVVDGALDRIQRFSSQGARLGTFGSSNPGLAQLHSPQGLDVSLDGAVYVADTASDGVVRFRAVPPDTTVSGPTGLIRDATPTFSFSSDQTPSAYECRLRGSGAAYKVCAVPSYTTPVLDDGLHILLVRAVDTDGLHDPTPAEHEFRVDATPPQTWFDSAPGATTTDTTPTFAFGASERGTFQCSKDGGAWATCTSPRTLPTLTKGMHTFRVRAKDRAGNFDPTPAVSRFEVR